MRNKYAGFFAAFLTVNALCWTIVPALTRKILPLDTIEALVWGSMWSFGNCKHPPLSGWIAELFYRLSGHADASQYLLSQLLIIVGLLAVYALGRLFLSREESIAGSLVLYCICFYTFTTPEYNVNVLEIAFWPVTALVFYRAVRDNRIRQWLLVGCCAALVIWTKYFSGLLLFSLFVYMLIDGKARSRFRSPGPYLAVKVFIILCLPHALWLHLHDYAPIVYAIGRTGAENEFNLANYLANMLRLVPMAAGIMLPAAVVLWFSCGMVSFKDVLARIRGSWGEDADGLKFFLTLLFVPLLVLQVLAIAGIGIRAMWYQPVFFAAGPLLVLFFRPWFRDFRWKRFASCITAVVAVLLCTYVAVNLVHTSKRVHFPADELCRLIEEKSGNTDKELIVIGDDWSAGMLHCYMPRHPKAIDGLDLTWKDKVDAALAKAGSGKCVIAFAVSDAGDVQSFRKFYPGVRIDPVSRTFSFKAPFGQVKSKEIFCCILPVPEAERK